jgi:hypothetical protein
LQRTVLVPMSFSVLLRQHVVALMRPIAFAAAQLNVALQDGAVSQIPAVPTARPLQDKALEQASGPASQTPERFSA